MYSSDTASCSASEITTTAPCLTPGHGAQGGVLQGAAGGVGRTMTSSSSAGGSGVGRIMTSSTGDPFDLRSERSEIGMSAGVSRSASPSAHDADPPPIDSMDAARERDHSEFRSSCTLPATHGQGEEESREARIRARSDATGERGSGLSPELDTTSQRASRSRNGATEQREEEMTRPGKRRATSGGASGALSSSPRASKRHQVGRS